MTIFTISDTHFNHKNVLGFKLKNQDKLLRPGFESVEHMNETIIQNWNETVRDNDIVYHLGDFSFTSKNNIEKFSSRLRGRKRLILGNHDYDAKYYYPHFEKVMSWRQFGTDMFSKHVFLCHYPLHASAYDYRTDGESMMIHGHLHEGLTGLENYVNVCVEHTNYTPVAIEDIVDGKFRNT